MNARNRKQLTIIRGQIEELKGKLDDLKNEIEPIKEDEEAVYDGMSEGRREGEKGQAVEVAKDALETAVNESVSAVDCLDTVITALQEAIDAGQ
jgi:predicted RNase H-like nuclease (RuvC/YqgF family)